MIIKKERTRLLITEFDDNEKHMIENLVASMDNVYLYFDEDNHLIGLPTGMEKTLKEKFRKSQFIDNSKEFWDFNRITPVEHNAQPRNQLQIDFIKFGIECMNNKEKFAGILSPGT